jgi:hypothetical protein
MPTHQFSSYIMAHAFIKDKSIKKLHLGVHTLKYIQFVASPLSTQHSGERRMIKSCLNVTIDYIMFECND